MGFRPFSDDLAAADAAVSDCIAHEVNEGRMTQRLAAEYIGFSTLACLNELLAQVDSVMELSNIQDLIVSMFGKEAGDLAETNEMRLSAMKDCLNRFAIIFSTFSDKMKEIGCESMNTVGNQILSDVRENILIDTALEELESCLD